MESAQEVQTGQAEKNASLPRHLAEIVIVAVDLMLYGFLVLFGFSIGVSVESRVGIDVFVAHPEVWGGMVIAFFVLFGVMSFVKLAAMPVSMETPSAPVAPDRLDSPPQ